MDFSRESEIKCVDEALYFVGQAEGRSRRVKRIMDGTPRPKTTAAPLTSEEMREKISGTESPHIHDYPDVIYKDPELTQSQWSNNNKTKNHTITEIVEKPVNSTQDGPGIKADDSSPLTAIQNVLEGLFG